MKLSILGTRGIPAQHGGFETFAEQLSLYLTSVGHEVTVYCQNERNRNLHIDYWQGVRRVHVYGAPGPLGTISFDWVCMWHSLKEQNVILTLGYNTAIFSLFYRLGSYVNLMNMDGIEWKREKWSPVQRLWLRLNEYAGAKLSRHLIADHPEIARHLEWAADRRKITVIPYGADAVHTASSSCLERFGLTAGNYALVIARPEPENSILEIVQAYSRQTRGIPLVVLGNYRPAEHAYHRKVMEESSDEVLFLGAIYDTQIVSSLRFFSRLYFHGHRVGGTNPSLVESLAAGNPIVAHDNRFTRWVCGNDARFFTGSEDLAALLNELLHDTEQLAMLSANSRLRHSEEFTREHIMEQYESLLLKVSQESLRESMGSREPSAVKKAG